MKNVGWFSRLLNQQPSPASVRRIAVGSAIAVLLLITGAAFGQNAAQPAAAPASQMSVPTGYSVHESIDLGGRYSDQIGSGAMYDTMVNLKSGPRVLGETFELHALPGTKGAPLDDLRAFASGFGGDPNNIAKLDFSKSKFYEFSAMFRRDRQYFDYDLLGNPNIPGGQSLAVSGSSTPYAWPQVSNSPFLYNTVRRMTDINVTLLPLSKLTFRFGYSHNIMQGPSISPSGYEVTGPYRYSATPPWISGASAVLLQEYQRNSTDDFSGGVDWKPVQGTKFTFEEQVDHYKGDSYFTTDPQYLNAQEADGTRVAFLMSYDSLTPYATSSCNTAALAGGAVLTAPASGTTPVINPACSVISSYFRAQPTRVLFPTEIFRLQSSSIKNISMNGNVRYTKANMNLPNYYESFNGLATSNAAGYYATTADSYTGSANARREVMAFDYGIVWQTSKTVSLEDQISYSNVRQPGIAALASGTATVISSGTQTINSSAQTSVTAAAGVSPIAGSPSIGPASPNFAGYFGQKFTTNNLTVSWDATPHSTFSFTYRYQDHLISEGQGTAAHNVPIPGVNTTSGEVTIHENGGIFNAALRPASNWDLNGSVEALYNDNAFTPMGFRQLRHYRVHTLYRPKSWATVSGAYNDVERHNNTNNQQSVTGNTDPYAGPLDHVDHSRVGSIGAQLFPNDRYGLDFNYTYSDVYMSDNICYLASASAALPGAAIPAGTACPNNAATRSGTYDFGPAKDFMDAPSQVGAVAFMYSPEKQIHSNIGYRITSVNGTRFYNDPRDVAGSLVSTYESPYLNFSWESRPGLIWKAEYNFFGYGEGGPSGAQYCSTTNPTPTAPVTPVLCSSLSGVTGTGGQTGMTISPAGETAPRNFHANNLTLGVHYEF